MREDTKRIIEAVQIGCTQQIVALDYARGLLAAANDRKAVDWGTVNRAILRRWKPSGLNRIKRLAHQSAGMARRAGETTEILERLEV